MLPCPPLIRTSLTSPDRYNTHLLIIELRDIAQVDRDLGPGAEDALVMANKEPEDVEEECEIIDEMVTLHSFEPRKMTADVVTLVRTVR